jgi:APA family basic amino acid/polyamine antiporter
MGLRVLCRTKSIDNILQDAEKPGYELKRTLGPIQLTMLGIGAIIGAGIYATIGTAAAGDIYRLGAGPSLILSFLITSVVCGFTALCYAEFASMVPISGSAYTYAYATLGELCAWIIGWNLIVEYAIGNVAVAISWSNYFKTFVKGFGITIPDWLTMDYRTAAKVVDSNGVQTIFQNAPHIFGIPIVFNFLAIAIIFVITVILIWGIRESAQLNTIMVIFKVIVLIFFIAIGAAYIKPEHWQPFAPNGWAGISSGAAIVFFAYIGFDAVSTVAEETKNPQKNIPIGIIASLIICTIFYIIVAVIFTGLIPYTDLRQKLITEQAEPLTMALQYVGTIGWAVPIVAFGSIVAQTAVLLVFQLGLPRIFFSMSRDGLLPPAFSKIHPRFKTPYFSTIITGVFVAVFAAFASIDEMVDLTNIGTLCAFILVCAGIIVLRIKEPKRPRAFRVPGGWLWAGGLAIAAAICIAFLPWSFITKSIIIAVIAVVFLWFRTHILSLLGILTCLYLVYYLPPTSWLRFAVWLYCGVVVYIAYGTINSQLLKKNGDNKHIKYNIPINISSVWLMILGTALLFLTRALDLFRKEGISGVFNGSSWLVLYWILIIPLLFNALVMCPVIHKRFRKGMQLASDVTIKKQAQPGIILNVLLGVLSFLYVVLLFVIHFN